MNGRKRLTLWLLGLPVSCLGPVSLGPAWAGVPATAGWFSEAVRRDAEGDASLAYSLYRRAAEAGMPEAEFNVAVMLDSGRGVRADVAQAATWYARAASHGDSRAAYNLGQLYEAGEGVPKNPHLARAWFTASALNAARDRLAATPTKASQAEKALKAPSLVAPTPGERLDARPDGLEFVWTVPSSTEVERFFLEMRALDAGGSHEVFTSFAEVSALCAKVAVPDGAYVWRVMVIAPESGRYASSAWMRFSVGSS